MSRFRVLAALLGVAAVGGGLGAYFGVRAVVGTGAGSPAGAPAARTGAAIAYDDATGTVVLFGGEGPNGALADTWTWDGSRWAQEHPSTSPPPRSGALMAYDPSSRDVILVGGENVGFGGITAIGCAEPGIVILPAPGGTPVPTPARVAPPRPCPVITPKPGTGPLQDTWRWSGSDWLRAGPAPMVLTRGSASLVTEPAKGTVLLLTVGPLVEPELGRACPLPAPLSEGAPSLCPPIPVRPAQAAYTLNASGWTRVASPPGGLDGFASTATTIAVDPKTHRVSLFETGPQSFPVCDHLPTDPGKTAPTTLPCGSPTRGAAGVTCCPGRVLRWTGSAWQSAGQFATGPKLTFGSILVGDDAAHAVLCVDPAGALWSWTGKWTRLSAARHPAVPDPVAVYDVKHGQLVLYGSGQTWTWDSSTGWNLRSGVASTPSPTPTVPVAPVPAEPARPLPASPGCLTTGVTPVPSPKPAETVPAPRPICSLPQP